MDNIKYLILNRVNLSNGSVTWYQIDRALRSKNLHVYVSNLPDFLNELEREGLLIQKENNDRPKLLFLTDKGVLELRRLKESNSVSD